MAALSVAASAGLNRAAKNVPFVLSNPMGGLPRGLLMFYC